MKLAILQFDICWENKPANFRKVRALAEGIGDNIDLLVLPELFSTGYTMRSRKLAEDLQRGETPRFLAGLARDMKAHVCGSFIAKTGEKPENTAVMFNPRGDSVLRYSKIHLMSLTKENRHYSPGRELPVVDFEGNGLAVTICYDLRFPELFLHLVRNEAACVINLANWPAERIAHWDILLRARAIENQIYMVGANRIGESPMGACPGHSAVIDPAGKLVASGAEEMDKAVIAEIDFGYVAEVRERFPVLEDKKLGL
ncbi:carbon-nitrogen family hydrolase [Fibrobacterota bacterium]